MPSSPGSSRPATELCCPYTEPRLRLDWHCLLPPGPRATLLIPCIAPTSAHWRQPGTAGRASGTAEDCRCPPSTHTSPNWTDPNPKSLSKDIRAGSKLAVPVCYLITVQLRPFTIVSQRYCAARHLYLLQTFLCPPSVFNSPKFLEMFGSHSFQGYAPIVNILGVSACPTFLSYNENVNKW